MRTVKIYSDSLTYYLNEDDVQKLNEAMPNEVAFKFALHLYGDEKADNHVFIHLKNTEGLNTPNMTLSISKKYKKILEDYVKKTYHTVICWDKGMFWFHDEYHK